MGQYGEPRVCRNPGEGEAEPVSLATRDDRRALQTALKSEGFNPGPADGIFGSGTRAAVKEWQESIGQAATGELTDEQVRLLLPRRQQAQAAVAEPAAGGVWASNATAPGASEDLWGSIVFSKNSGGGYTWAFVWNAGGHEPARQEAVDLCQQEGGSNCAEIGWFRNACGALAVDPTGVGGYGTGWGSDTGEAEAMALLECESAGNTNCQLKASRCSNAGLEFAGIGEPGEVLAPTTVETEAASWTAGHKFRDCPECPEMVVVPSGSFMMGSPESEEGRESSEGPVHRVTIARPFAVGVYEVTFGEWDACVNDRGCGGHRPDDEGWGRGNRPVINVSWEDAQAYVRWLSRKTGEEVPAAE